ncbi:MAG: DUF1330 domain-containing protein [Paracoccaceae bacterium]|nr:DUF1330 domain-containing protein [Paracoccaceae bacterium]
MPKGYWVANVDVDSPEDYAKYVAANAVAFEKYGARFLVRGGKSTVVEGEVRSRIVVLEFKDYETALACYNSPEYQQALRLRLHCSRANLAIVEGWDG